jgi:hypothetical protein
MSEHQGLPVAGYKPTQSQVAIDLVNRNKVLEERVLRVLDELKESGVCDARWLATGRTDIEKGFSSVNRSIFKPARVDLGDAPL